KAASAVRPMSSRSPTSGARRWMPTSARPRASPCSPAGAPRWAGCRKAARPPWAPTTVPGSEESRMKPSLGPALFYWTREKLQNFYAEMLEQPLDIIYLGETVCSKRRAFSLDGWLGLARELREAGCQAELVLSGLTLIEAASELSSLRRLCNNGELLVEANDIGAVQMLNESRLPFVAGPALNIYNGQALAELIDMGMQRWCPPVECSGALVRDSLQQLDTLGVARPEVELFAYGHLPLAYSARCFTARAEN